MAPAPQTPALAEASMIDLWPHWFRPWWVLLLPLLGWLLWQLWHRQKRAGRWQIILPPAFHAVLLSGGNGRESKSPRSEEHTSELQSHRDLHSFPTRRSSDLAVASAKARRALADHLAAGVSCGAAQWRQWPREQIA